MALAALTLGSWLTLGAIVGIYLFLLLVFGMSGGIR